MQCYRYCTMAVGIISNVHVCSPYIHIVIHSKLRTFLSKQYQITLLFTIKELYSIKARKAYNLCRRGGDTPFSLLGLRGYVYLEPVCSASQSVTAKTKPANRYGQERSSGKNGCQPLQLISASLENLLLHVVHSLLKETQFDLSLPVIFPTYQKPIC